MSLAEIKERIHEEIENLSDQNVLLVIDDLLAHAYRPDKEVRLTLEQKSALEGSEADLVAGRILSRENATAQVSDWLNKNP